MNTTRSRKRWLRLVTPLSIVVALTAAGCVRTGVRDYDGWRAAVEHGQPCSELYDIRSKLPASVDRNAVDPDLREIGCDSPQAKRADR
jgi:hypothetical protein